ncbi:acyltransferase family protein [Pseudopedobacter beijingensis]|uniref:Acyltransferase family protein n=1 Tax=Pseudopedobacter beijingensis TaxID=1207056 RepID=A0ABW4IJU2_9SPHI
MTANTTLTSKTRYLSLDVLRGLTVALMIVVNTPGSWSYVYPPLKHAAWHGFTVTDLVFPTFLFVVGNAMSFGMTKLKQGSQQEFLKKVFSRTLKIFLIGLFLNIFPFVKWENDVLVFKNIMDIRIWGVLQRIAVCYMMASLLVFYFKPKTVLGISGVILLGYWGIMHAFGTGADPYSLEGNASGKLDALILNARNLYKGFGIPFDPEGLLSTFPATINVILGYFTGVFIQKNGNNVKTVQKLVGIGAGLLILGLVLDTVFPINKPIWTSSFVLYTVGWDFILIAVLMLLIEVWQLKKWTYFFEVFGKNPLFIYALSGMLVRLFHLIYINGENIHSGVFNGFFMKMFEPMNASLFYAISYMLILWLVGVVLDKKKIYIKV